MRVALLTDKFSTGGGLEHIYQLCAGMPDIQFGVFGKPGDAQGKFANLENVKVFFSSDKATIEAFEPDLVHYHHLKPLFSLSVPAGRKLFTVHGVHLHRYEFQSGIRSLLGYFARLTLEKILYRRVDHIITVSNEDADYIRDRHGYDSTTIYNGIDFEPIQKLKMSKLELRTDLGLPINKNIYLTVARFDFPKGHETLVRAIAVMKRDGTIGSRQFIFAGDGQLMSAIKVLADDLLVGEYIQFLGTRSDIYRLMRASDVFVLPSLWEGLPITLIEALVTGIPAVASRTYGITTVASEANENVTLFENRDHEDLARVLASNRSYIDCNLDKFRLQSMIDATRKVYLEN